MTPEEWREAKTLLAEALELPADRRAAWLDLRCGDDLALRRELEALLAAAESDGFLDGKPRLPGPAIAEGEVLGPYKIERKLGEGGMGEVYQAFDSRLGRRVAIKVLPARLSQDASALKRFERETQALAALSHPNILTIFDVGRKDGTAFAVTELLTGATLRQRLERGKLPLANAVEIAVQTARGLAVAHAAGIVHRDLKPENLFVTAGGPVKILDFGIATFTSSRAGSGETPLRLTVDNAVIGTARYMSPEQAQGKSCDHRSDLFSLGAVLYEMLTSAPAFPGDTPLAALLAVIDGEPTPLGTLCPAASPQLVRIVQRCLEKDPARRFQSASDLAFHLETLATAPTTAATPAILAGRRRGILRVAAVAGLLLAAAFFAGILIQRSLGSSEPPRLLRLTFRHGDISAARFAPDGQTIVYSASWDGGPYEIFTTRTDGPESRSLGLSPALLHSISSRGEMLIDRLQEKDGVIIGWTLARVPLAGGAPRPILDDPAPHIADWPPEGETFALLRTEEGRTWQIEYPRGNVIWRANEFIWGLRVAPAGDAVAFCASAGLLQSIVIVDRASKVVTRSDGWRLASQREGVSSGCVSWAPSGKDLWFAAARGSGAGLHALTRAGKVRSLLRVPGTLALLDTARDGRVLFAQANQRNWIMAQGSGATNERDLSWFDSSELADLSVDGRWILFTEGGPGGGARASVYLRGTDGSPAVRLGDGLALALSPDARWALARSATDTKRLFLLPTGAGEPRDLPSVSVDVFAAKWLPDGKRLIVYATEPGKGDRLYVMDLEGKELRPLTQWGSSWHWAISPNGSQVATFGLGGVKIYPISGGTPRTVPGVPPVGEVPIQWRADGRALYVGHVGFFGSRRYQIDEVDITTGKRVPWKELRLTDPAGAEIVHVVITPNGAAYAYSVWNSLSTLYLAEGLR